MRAISRTACKLARIFQCIVTSFDHRATAFTFYKALQTLAPHLLYKYFYVVAKTAHIKGSRVNAVALPLIIDGLLKLGATDVLYREPLKTNF
jgi:hypothetical protein